MSSTTDSVVHPVVAGLRAVADELAELPVWRLSGVEQANLLAEVETEQRRIAFGALRLLADIDARNVAVEQAGIPTVEFLRRRLRISPSEAKARLRAARELVDSISPSGEPVAAALPDTAEAAADGMVSLEHVRVISRVMEKLPSGLDPEIRTDAEIQLATHAVSLDPAALSIVGRRIHLLLDPDGALDADRPARRELAFVRDIGGCDVLRGRFDTEAAAVIRTAVDAISAPEPEDTRTPARRRADGLVELCRRYLDSGQAPMQHGEKPHIIITMRLDDLSASLGGQPIIAEQARRLACDAAIIPTVLSSDGEPLDIGRATRTIPPAIRRALTIRDKGCIHPGCPKPVDWCDAHHVRHWSAGGPTALNNLVLLCHKHHWIIHHTQWRIVFQEGIPYVIAPPLIDPDQQPQRNTVHDTG